MAKILLPLKRLWDKWGDDGSGFGFWRLMFIGSVFGALFIWLLSLLFPLNR